jgi:hypothetical protein
MEYFFAVCLAFELLATLGFSEFSTAKAGHTRPLISDTANNP